MSDSFLRKVVDPRTHMPDDVKLAFHELMRDGEHSNDSFMFWRVGQHDHDHPDDHHYLTVETWLRSNFATGEEVIILFWW